MPKCWYKFFPALINLEKRPLFGLYPPKKLVSIDLLLNYNPRFEELQLEKQLLSDTFKLFFLGCVYNTEIGIFIRLLTKAAADTSKIIDFFILLLFKTQREEEVGLSI